MTDRMRNILWQYAWALFYRRKVEWSPPGLMTDHGMDLTTLIDAMRYQIETAEKFGTIRLVILGDSNAEVWRQALILKQFRSITVCLGKGGSTPQQWAVLCRAPGFLTLLAALPPECMVLWNCGGNSGWSQKAFDAGGGVQKAYAAMHAVTPGSQMVLVPPIWDNLIDPGGISGVKDRMHEINALALQEWGKDAHDPAKLIDWNGDGVPELISLAYPIHYSRFSLRLMVPIIKVLVHGKQVRWP